MRFEEKLKKSWDKSNSLLCVGLDPDLPRINELVKGLSEPIFEFCKQIVDATADLVCAFKPQIAHFAALSAEAELEKLIGYISDKYPDVVVILDSKRGDIGSTARRYALEAFDRYKADAVTLNPYLGFDSIKPFSERADKGAIVLCRTSNPSAREFQDLVCEGKPLYQQIAIRATSDWNANRNILLVIGATYPDELKQVRELAPELPFLVPGVGAQGGDVEAVVKSGVTSDGNGLLINSSRGIIFAGKGADFASKSREAALLLRDEINSYRA